MASLEGKVISITGAASGMGLQLANLAASRGAKLALADIQEEPLKQLVDELVSSGVDAIGTRVNVASDKEVDAWVEATINHFGQLDGAANLAGVEGKHGLSGSLVNQANEEWDFILSINLTGLMYCVRAQLRVMKSGSSIVNASSIVGLVGRPGMCAYAVSKHGVAGLTKTAAKEAGPSGIRVNAVAPGSIETPMLQRVFDTEAVGDRAFSTAPLGRNGKPEEVAKLFAFLLSDDSSYISGGVYLIDGGLIA
ncbi:uncharacterized protein A1O5_10773 [Cladophialophora psammophila CBS 110553]|uniref:Oxidoreductase n=1 Tax=Cladophialophora psammophila CBS 110553 TaxID=1182543 RepID=W9WDG9_9EURO|nr:uncharacterized protein A1O5_10773 [Cladophialophora psammophila CBS 110553]EXJ66157.1 hypothetical protein A1O5_10773 [Cladophialophora psammophila CBS 110553]